MKRAIFFLLALLPLTSACNTMQGIGEDLQLGGRALTDAASPAPQPANAAPQGQNNSSQKNTSKTSMQH
jgi:predicted small secreted protein